MKRIAQDSARRCFRVATLLVAVLLSLAPQHARASGVDPTRISLPKGPGSIEGLATQDFAPSLSSGTASYSIPIAVPPASGGFGPAIALAYDSGGGVTEVGMGWRLSGVARIRRRVQDGLPRFDESDTFELVGIGIPSELLEVAPDTFRPRYEDGSFVRVRRSSDGSEWEARTKSRITLRFGGDGFTESEGARASAHLLREQLDRHGHVVRYEWDTSEGHALLTRVVWNDFGAGSRNEVRFEYEARPDFHRWFGNGIRQTFGRRLVRVDVTHGDDLVRRYELAYDDAALPRLTTVTLVGRDGESRLPSARFDYIEASLAATAEHVVTMQNAPGPSPAEADAELADLDGDALPDLLIATAGSYRSYVNHDGERWLAGESWTAAESPSVSLSTAGVQLADLDADGAPDLIVKSGIDSFRYYPEPMRTRFGAPVTVATVPTFSFEDPNVRLADMDGDRRTDVIMTTPSGIAIGYNLDGTDWTEPVVIGPVDSRQELLFSDGMTELCDVNGDRVQDFCHLRSGSLTYWLGRGRGLFEPAGTARGVPSFDVAAPFRLVDLNGDGWVDLVRVETSAVSYALAVAEGQFAPVATVSGTPAKGTATTVEFADMNGSGTTDIVWIDVSGSPSQSWRYLELFPDGRGGLLRRIDNGLGKVQTIEYKPAALDAARARDAGTPWTTRMNIAMPVVSRVTVDSSLGDPLLQSEFSYRDGAYDSLERTFAAFGGGTLRQPGDAHTPTLLSDSTFDTGLVDRVLRGALLRQELRDESGYLFQVTTNDYTRRPVAEALDGRSVEYAFKSAERVEHVEGEPTAARITLTEVDQDDFGNVIEERRWGEVAGDDVLAGNDETIVERTYANNAEDWLLGFMATEEILDASGHRLAMTRKYYDGTPFQGLPLGEVARGDLTREEAWVGPDDGAFELVNATRYNADGQPVETRDGIGGGRFFEWADDRTTLRSERVKLDSDVELVEIARTDSAFGNLLAVTEYNGQTTRYEYDPFGRLTAIFRPGDTDDAPTVRYGYVARAPLSRVITEARVGTDMDASDAPGDSVERSEKLVDGLGRERGTLSQDGERWLLAGVSLFDARGNVRRALLPRYVDAAAYDTPPLLDASPRGSDTWYDAMGRTVRTRSELGIESRTRYLPFETHHWDGGQSDPASPYEHTPAAERIDGQGRTVEHVRTLNGEPLAARYTFDAAGRLLSRTDPESHTARYTYDGRGRRVRVLDPDLGEYRFVYDPTGNVTERIYPDGVHARFRFDLAGRLLAEDHDGDGTPEIEQFWDRSDRHPESPLYRGKLARVNEPTGHVEHDYDERARVTATHYTIDGNTYTVRSEYDAQDREVLHVYPDGSSLAIRRNPRGQIAGYGRAVDFEYAEDGLETARRFNTGVVVESGYDEDRRRTDLHILSPDGSVIERLHWTYDVAGNLRRIEDRRPDITPDHDRSETYEYDNLYRLTRAEGTWGETEWHYSPSGSLLRRVSSVTGQQVAAVQYGPRPHAPIAFDERRIEYDPRGRMLDDGKRTYTWNAADQLERVTQRDGASVESRYGAEGVRRVKVERTAGGSEKKTLFIDAWTEVRDDKLVRYIVHSGQRIVRLAENNGTSPPAAGALQIGASAQSARLAALIALLLAAMIFVLKATRRALRPIRWAPLAVAAAAVVACSGDNAAHSHPTGTVEELSDEDTLLLSDLLGSTLAETSGEGTPKAAFATYPFGYPRYDDSRETQQYAGSPRDNAVLLDHMGARFYAPDLGVWSSGEPLAVAAPEDLVTQEFAAANPYAYANLTPLVAADHDGNFWHIVAGGLIGGVSSGAIEAAVQYAREGRISDWGRIGAASVGGAVSGSIAAANPAAGLVSFHGINGVSGIVGGLTERLIGSGGKDAGTLTDVAIDGAISVATGGRARNASSVKRAAPRAPAPPQRKAHDFSSHEAWKRDYTASRAGGDAMCPCFGAGTLVETAEGLRPIETVRVGDLVLSRDEGTGETGYQPVTQVFITPDKEVLELTVIDDDGGSETLVTTPGHPFWVDGQGWVTAAELRVGEVLMTAEQGLATLSAALSREGRRTVYNLEVEGWHTYFVGEAGAWVHNACRCGGGETPRDHATKNTKNWSATMQSEGDARALARTKLGSNPVEVEPGKLRSADGKWQYRAKPSDVADDHVHLEELNPATGEVKQNVHLRWPNGEGR